MMRRTDYPEAETYMHTCMTDSAHDREHVYRVLNYALDIAAHEGGADTAVLVVACLLHDIGRAAQFADPAVDHAEHGAGMAHAWLLENGYSTAFADHVRDCIQTHRYRSGIPPQTLEAKVLFDADKLDVCGAVGIARTFLYQAHENEPMYTFAPDGTVSDGSSDTAPSFMQEYRYKLEKVYGQFYTTHGRMLAQKREAAAAQFYRALLNEVRECYGEEGGL